MGCIEESEVILTGSAAEEFSQNQDIGYVREPNPANSTFDSEISRQDQIAGGYVESRRPGQ